MPAWLCVDATAKIGSWGGERGTLQRSRMGFRVVVNRRRGRMTQQRLATEVCGLKKTNVGRDGGTGREEASRKPRWDVAVDDARLVAERAGQTRLELRLWSMSDWLQ